MKREFSAGGAVYKGNLWLIIKPRPSPDFPADRYQLPKGQIEPAEKPTDTVLREVFEETGIKAKIVSFYLMEYLSGEPKENAEVEKVLWLPFDEAKKTLTYSSDKSVLQKANNLLEKQL